MKEYFHALADASPRASIQAIGRRAKGEPILLLFISSEENLALLDEWRRCTGPPRVSGPTAASIRRAGAPGVMNVELGSGNVVLVGFPPQFRGQPRGTDKLLFHAIQRAATGVRPVS